MRENDNKQKLMNMNGQQGFISLKSGDEEAFPEIDEANSKPVEEAKGKCNLNCLDSLFSRTNVKEEIVELEIGFRWKNTLLGHVFGKARIRALGHFLVFTVPGLILLLTPSLTSVGLCVAGVFMEDRKEFCLAGFVLALYFILCLCMCDIYIALEAAKRTSFPVSIGLAVIVIIALGDLFDYDYRIGVSIPFALLVVCVQFIDALPPVIYNLRVIAECFLALTVFVLGPAFAFRLLPLNEKDFNLGDLNGLSHRVIKYNNLQLACEVMFFIFVTTIYDLYCAFIHGRYIYLRIQTEVVRNPELNDMD